MRLGLGYQTVKTAGLYLVPIKSYLKKQPTTWTSETDNSIEAKKAVRLSPF